MDCPHRKAVSMSTRGVCRLAAILILLSCLAATGQAAARSFDRLLLRKYFKCPLCRPEVCPLPEGFPQCELILEPGVCGCCQVCAKRLGDLCGLGAGRCGEGLTCRPKPGDPDPLGAILTGRAVCL